MAEKFLAHISEDGREQTIFEHLNNVANAASDFAEKFNAGEQGFLVGIAHDLGKYSCGFQKRLHGGSIVDHATAGGQLLWKQKQPYGAFCAAGHHTGLPNLGSKVDTCEDATMYGRMKKCVEDYAEFKSEIKLPLASFPAYCGKNLLTDSFFIRMLFSALTDADFLDTEKFMTGEREPIGRTIPELHKSFENFISGWFPPKTELNKKRCDILKACIQSGQKEESGLFSLTVPTGGGKTIASMGFALEQAKKLNKDRIIYVIPYTSIIEQTAQKFREVFGEESVLEHHSGVHVDLSDYENAQNIRMAKATENWDAPIVVTTAVQFFESLFGNRSSKCRKLHNIANSVIIFDEAQMLPIPFLKPCVFAITELVKNYHVTALLCTATQPALDKIIQAFLPNQPVREICPAELSSAPIFRRVTIQGTQELSWDELTEKLNANAQVLCIVNSRKNAQRVYEKLDGKEVFHLSTLMCPQHRRIKLDEIRRRLRNGEACRVVSTSLIEAGVDVDFPVVYREEAGLDSIIQAAGRCNREGRADAEQSTVNIFKTDTPAPPSFAIPIGATRLTQKNYAHIDSDGAVRFYFENLLNLKGDETLDAKNILARMTDGTFPFEDVARDFHLIEDNTQTVYVPWNAGADLIDRLRNGEQSKRLFRELGSYSVNIYSAHFNALVNAGDLELLDTGIAILRNERLYSEATGLSLDADFGKAMFI